jgi:hypothetical protein
MKRFLVIVDRSASGHGYVVTITESGNSRALPGRKFYQERTLLERDLAGCLNAEDIAGVAYVLQGHPSRRSWSSVIPLSDVSAAQLGYEL